METNIAEEDLRRKRQKVSSTTSILPLQNAVANNPPTTTAMDSSNVAEAIMGRNSKEEEVGITEYVDTSIPGFTGVLKKRYTDFIVNEITEDGIVVHLTETSLPKRVEQVKAEPGAIEPESQASKTGDSTEKTDAGDVKVEQQDGGDAEAKTGENHVPTDTKVVQDVKVEAVDDSEFDALVPDGKTETSDSKVEEAKDDAEKPVESSVEESPISSEDRKLLTGYFGTQVCDSILALYNKVLQRPDGKASSYGTVTTGPINDRPLRTQIHQNVRRIFQGKFETSSNEDGTMRVAAAGKLTRGGQQGDSGNRRQQYGAQYGGQPKGKLGWKELGGEYLHFTLLKENKDTMEVISYLSTSLHVQPKVFGFAGTKDRRGVTAQRISLYRVDAKKLLNLNRTLYGSKVGGLKYEKHGLQLGDLYGNQFIIVLRDCRFPNESAEESLDETSRLEAAKKIVEESVKNMSQEGFLNYYGLQRFGSFSIGTHEIGRYILKGDFRSAIQAILSFNPDLLDEDFEQDKNNKFGRDDIARAIAIEMFEKGNNEAALRKMPKKFSAEIAILRWLKGQRQNDYLGALLTISRALRLMYVHAYQSLVWNRAASERWVKFGNSVVEGDLVLVESKDVQNGTGENAEAEEVDENGEVIVKPAEDDAALSLEDQYQRARALSKEEALSGQYSIFDIVLPTPGYDIEYPKNEIGEFYKTFMASEEGGGLDPLNMRRSQKDFSMSGSYRKLLGKAEDVSFELKMYSEENEQLVETDMDRYYAANPKFQRNNQQSRPQQQQSRTQQQQPRHQQQQSRHYQQENQRPQQHQRTPYRQPQIEPPTVNSWANFKGNLAESDKALADLARAEKAAKALEPPKETPKVEDKFIETSAKTGKRTGFRETVIQDGKPSTAEDGNVPEGSVIQDTEPSTVEDDKTLVPEGNISTEASNLAAPEDIPLPATPHPEASSGSNTLKRSAAEMIAVGRAMYQLDPAAMPFAPRAITQPSEQMDTEMSGTGLRPDAPSFEPRATPPTPEKLETEMVGTEQNGKQPEVASSEVASKEAESDSQDPPKKLAVIITFKLGSSQYATMALRELMKSGGVQEYKSSYAGR